MFTQNIVKSVKICQNSCIMEISQVQYERIADCFPVHRGNVAYDNLKVLNAMQNPSRSPAVLAVLPKRPPDAFGREPRRNPSCTRQ